MMSALQNQNKRRVARSSWLMIAARAIHILFLSMALMGQWSAGEESTAVNASDVFSTEERVVVNNQAMGARCAVAADFDGDGRQDLVSASSNDNAVSWYRNEGVDPETGQPVFSIKKQITWNSLGSRIVTVADIDGDGDVDVVGASYYDSTLRWFENDGEGNFISHVISTAVNEGQGVTVADLDNDGDPDIASASSGDNTIAVFKNLDRGTFCEIKEVVDDNAVGARTVVAADLNGDGWTDLASASKDDNTIAWYPNDGAGNFPTKVIISAGNESLGAYSLVAVDIDDDGDQDLIVASNGNDQVSLWRNDGSGQFAKTLIFDNADFVLSVTAVDFDRDGDMDVASASFFDGHINWYENVDGKGYVWKNHTIYVGIQGHYVSYADMDGDGDDDLIAVTHAENTVAVFLAQTGCDLDGNTTITPECCHKGTEWNGTACEPCGFGTYGIGHGSDAECIECPTYVCTIPGHTYIPATCSGITGCIDVEASLATCSCPEDTMLDPLTDTCEVCADGQIRPDSGLQRTTESLGNYTLWEIEQGTCYVEEVPDYTAMIAIVLFIGVLGIVLAVFYWRRQHEMAKEDALWTIDQKEITFDDPAEVLGKGAFGEVLKGYYRGTAVAIKKTRRTAKTASGADSVDGTRSDEMSSVMKSAIRRASHKRNTMTVVAFGGSDPDLEVGQNFSELSVTEHRKLFIEEMRTLSKLRHPCITTLMGAVLGDEPFLVMEFMENGSLRDLLSNKTFPLDPEQTLPLIRDILQGVRFLHSGDPPIVHGDLKCANVLVDSNFRAKISDFGMACSKRAVGTPFWMAPEILCGGDTTKESDVYSFGVLLWEVMTHKIPYEDIDIPSKEILNLICMGRMRPDCDHGLDKELVECMQECWAQDPDKRPSLEDLEMKLIPLCGQNLFSMMQERHQVANQQSNLLQDVFPEHIAKDLLAGRKVEPEHHECVSIYFSDIVGFTTISAALTAAEVSDLLDRLYTQFDELAGKHGVFKLETIGDAWVGVTNLNDSHADHAARIARFSIDAMAAAQRTIIHPGKPEMGCCRIRVGFHSGPVVSSVVGTRNPRYCLFGDTMNTASRMESTSKELRIQCSNVAAQLAKEQDKNLKFTYRGKIKVKGKGKMKSFWLHTGTKSDADLESDDSEVLDDSSHPMQRMSSGYLQPMSTEFMTQVKKTEEVARRKSGIVHPFDKRNSSANA